MRLFQLSAIVEYERANPSKGRGINFKRCQRVIQHLRDSSLDNDCLILMIDNYGRPESKCNVPSFGYNFQVADKKVKMNYQPEFGVQRLFNYHVVVSCPVTTIAGDLLGNYEFKVHAPKTIHHETKAMITVCASVPIIENPTPEFEAVRIDGHPSEVAHNGEINVTRSLMP